MLRKKLEQLKGLGWTLDDLIELVMALEVIDEVDNKERIKEVYGERKFDIYNDSEALQIKIADIIKKIGISTNIVGYKYIIDAVNICIKDINQINLMTKNLYPKIAEHFNTSSCRVERGIRYAIEKGWKEGNIDFQEKIFGNIISAYKGKPTNSQFIATLVEYISHRYISK